MTKKFIVILVFSVMAFPCVVLPEYAIANDHVRTSSSSNPFIAVTVNHDENTTEDDTISSELEKSLFLYLDSTQNFISVGVEAIVKNIDEFFSADKIFYETSGTYLRLRLDSIFKERGSREYRAKVRLKLRLPNTTKKLKFTIESNANERADANTIISENSPIAADEENDYFAGIEAIIGKENTWKFKPSLGIKLGSSVEPYARFRFKRKYDLDEWNVNWYETPYWFDSFGWGVDSYIEVNNIITESYLFRAATFARWTNESEQFELSQIFSIFHTFNKKRAVSYYVGIYGVSEPTVIATHYLLGVTYRKNIHKDYLFIELLPQIRYEKTNDFHAEYSITFRVEMVFKK